ncbi:hypothetical protein [Nostoc sp.]
METHSVAAEVSWTSLIDKPVEGAIMSIATPLSKRLIAIASNHSVMKSA